MEARIKEVLRLVTCFICDLFIVEIGSGNIAPDARRIHLAVIYVRDKCRIKTFSFHTAVKFPQ